MEMTIGANIKRLRTAKNITQEQLSVAMNVTCAAVSKWERGETYPDITLLQPLAYFFEVTLDELMGYDQKKVQADIDETIALYRKHWKDSKGREIIVKAYHDYPNDYRIMHYYMWNIGGDMADNNPTVLIEHKEEFLSICEKILDLLGRRTEEGLTPTEYLSYIDLSCERGLFTPDEAKLMKETFALRSKSVESVMRGRASLHFVSRNASPQEVCRVIRESCQAYLPVTDSDSLDTAQQYHTNQQRDHNSKDQIQSACGRL